jgi:tetratricopeptide (TPR) repeat protein
MSKKEKTTTDSLENVESALSKTEHFIEKNQKVLMTIVLAIVVIVGGYWAYMKFYKKPLEEEVKSQMFVAERYFEKDSFNLALNGDANYPGFLQILEEYGSTTTGNLANYYAGVCYMNLNDYDNAIEFFSNFKTTDMLLEPITLGAIGDAYLEKGETEKAIDYYKKASITRKNEFTTAIYLKKLGQILEQEGKFEEALAAYEEIFNDYSKSTEARTIEKYIARVKVELGIL